MNRFSFHIVRGFVFGVTLEPVGYPAPFREYVTGWRVVFHLGPIAFGVAFFGKPQRSRKARG